MSDEIKKEKHTAMKFFIVIAFVLIVNKAVIF